MMITPGYESSGVKEARAPETDYPDWGDVESRGAYWEIATSISLLATGAELLVMYHPEAVKVVKQKIAQAFGE